MKLVKIKYKNVLSIQDFELVNEAIVNAEHDGMRWKKITIEIGDDSCPLIRIDGQRKTNYTLYIVKVIKQKR
jgi:small-conductance mechanosensitive channel